MTASATRICRDCGVQWQQLIRHIARQGGTRLGVCESCRIERRNARLDKYHGRPIGLAVIMPGEWVNEGHCNQSDPEAWWPDDRSRETQQQALKICRGCPVQVACLKWALDNQETDGIWGATTPEQRAELRRLVS